MTHDTSYGPFNVTSADWHDVPNNVIVQLGGTNAAYIAPACAPHPRPPVTFRDRPRAKVLDTCRDSCYGACTFGVGNFTRRRGRLPRRDGKGELTCISFTSSKASLMVLPPRQSGLSRTSIARWIGPRRTCRIRARFKCLSLVIHKSGTTSPRDVSSSRE